MRRVVITGVGLITPAGTGTEKSWKNIVEGKSGIGTITRFDASAYPVKIAGEVKDFHVEHFIDAKEIPKMDLFIQFAIGASIFALEDAGLSPEGFENPERVGVIIGAGFGGLPAIEHNHSILLKGGARRITPFFIPMVIPNLASGWVSILTGAKGINLSISTACSAGLHAVGEAYRYIKEGKADIIICGGTEASISPLAIAGFSSMKALSRRNDEPQKASRPFEKNRDGFVIGEGAGILILEEYECAKKREAEIYAEIVGYGVNSDAHHITSPSPEGKGAEECMKLALHDAKITPEEIEYINAHGTSTKLNDLYETMAIKRVFKEHAYKLMVSSTKSIIGHTLGAAGGIECAILALTIKHSIIPPTINYEEKDPECDLDYVPNTAREKNIKTGMSNSFGFGGTNGCIIMRRI